jgi:CheY-like chemotaxis protein
VPVLLRPQPAAAPVRTGQPLTPVAPAAGSLRVLVVAGGPDLDLYPTGPHARLTAHTTGDAIAAIERERPALVVIDWDLRNVDAVKVCRAAVRFPMMRLLMTTASPDTVPAAIRAGCQAVLLKPFARNLAAARIGRLSRQVLPGPTPLALAAAEGRGTNRRWLGLTCPGCSAAGIISFEFSSQRRLWFACLECSHVWRTASPHRAHQELAPGMEQVSGLPRAV